MDGETFRRDEWIGEGKAEGVRAKEAEGWGGEGKDSEETLSLAP